MQKQDMNRNPTVDRAEFLRLAELAALSFEAGEADEMLADLQKSVALFAELSAIEADTVGEGAALPFAALREDVVREGMPREALLKNAPSSDDTYLLVPRVVE